MKAFRKVMALILALTICLGMALSFASCGNNDDETIEITDMSGTTVKIPKSPKKVAAVSPSTGDLMIAFGLDFMEAYGVVVSSVSNIGPALGDCAALNSWAPLPSAATVAIGWRKFHREHRSPRFIHKLISTIAIRIPM